MFLAIGATITAILSLAWGANLLPPKVLAVVVAAAVLAFWITLVAHFQDVEDTSGDSSGGGRSR